jgi:hypothetical protein
MTEAQWLAKLAEPSAMLFAIERQASDRKLLLFAVACCRRIWDRLDDASRSLLLATERYGDGGCSKSQLLSARRLVRERTRQYPSAEWYATAALRDAASVHDSEPHGSYSPDQAMGVARLVTRSLLPTEFINGIAIGSDYSQTPEWKGESAGQASLVRDIFGNPFRPVTFSPAWRTDTAVALVRQMYEARDFSAMPILADALQDAGCDSDDILTHCRGEGPHVRGCWVVDLVLRRE